MNIYRFILLLLFVQFANLSFSQIDSLILSNGNVIVGEVKSMNKNVITIETDYSDSDFKIEWNGVNEIYTERTFLINLVNGKRLSGRIITENETQIRIIGEHDNEVVDKSQVIFLDEYGNDFLSNFYAAVDVGFTLTKANNLAQLTVGASAGYLHEKWTLDLNFNSLNSTQDEVDPTRRTGGGLGYNYLLPKKWFLFTGVDLLSNTEQSIDLRSTGKLGLGYLPIKNNKLYWSFGIGAVVNNESYYSPLDSANTLSYEGYLGSEINLFNVNDFSLMSNINVFPSFTENGRVRVDYMINTKYDLPMDFYIGLNFTLNYDNKPAQVGSEVDYIFGVSFGWDW